MQQKCRRLFCFVFPCSCVLPIRVQSAVFYSCTRQVRLLSQHRSDCHLGPRSGEGEALGNCPCLSQCHCGTSHISEAFPKGQGARKCQGANTLWVSPAISAPTHSLCKQVDEGPCRLNALFEVTTHKVIPPSPVCLSLSLSFSLWMHTFIHTYLSRVMYIHIYIHIHTFVCVFVYMFVMCVLCMYYMYCIYLHAFKSSG